MWWRQRVRNKEPGGGGGVYTCVCAAVEAQVNKGHNNKLSLPPPSSLLTTQDIPTEPSQGVVVTTGTHSTWGELGSPGTTKFRRHRISR